MTYISWSSDFALYFEDYLNINIILRDYESVWHDIWPQNKCRHCDLYFMVQWFYLISWRLFDVWTPYFEIMSQYDPMFDLKIFVANCDLYFMIQWFCLISWKLFSGWTSYFGIMNQYDPTYDLQIFVGYYDLSFMVHWVCPFILKTVWCMNIILSDYESVWHDIWSRNKCRSLWPIFHGPVILPYILNSIWWLNVILSENESV